MSIIKMAWFLLGVLTVHVAGAFHEQFPYYFNPIAGIGAGMLTMLVDFSKSKKELV